MLGNPNIQAGLFILDTSSISQLFSAFSSRNFPTLWGDFDRLAQNGQAVSVRAVRTELTALSRVSGAVRHLENLNAQFFAAPTPQEEALVQQMAATPGLSAAANRWVSKARQGKVDADPYLVAKARTVAIAALVTEESQDAAKTDRLPAVCRRFGIDCIDLDEMIFRLGRRY